MEMNYKAKIKKLLALAESPVEAEAQAALLKARAAHAENLHTKRLCGWQAIRSQAPIEGGRIGIKGTGGGRFYLPPLFC